MRSSSIGCRSNWNLPQVVIFIWSHSIVVNIGACHASVESSILSGTAKFLAPFVYRLGHPPFTQVRAVRFCYGAPCFKEICMPMYETTVKTPNGEKKDQVYAQNAKEAKQLFEQRYGPRNVPYIPHVIAS